MCVVTGAAQGIGAAVARAALDAFDLVIGLDVRPVPGQDVRNSGRLKSIVGDVRDRDAHAAAVVRAREAGDLRGWVNVAGIAPPAPLHEVTRDDAEAILAVNLLGAAWGMAAAVSAMSAGGGSIVNISSTQARLGFPGHPLYAASKGGIEALSRQVASEYVTSAIRCNVVAPGVIDTPMNRRFVEEAADPDALRAVWDGLSPIGRWGTPQDVADAVLFLLDDRRSSYITGQVLVVDGGQTIVPPGPR